jgi:hypothetical protein
LSVYPRKYLSDGTPVLPSEAEIAEQAKLTDNIERWRSRLADLGWFMKAFKEPIARRANREDECSGTFWEGRFHSVPLLDQAALIACMAYVDLNPIRAKVADRPESAEFTGGHQRIRVRNRHRTASRIRQRYPQASQRELAGKLVKAGIANEPAHAEDGTWLAPLARCQAGEPLAQRTFTIDDYLRLLDASGRMLRQGKRGAIPPELAPILERLDLSVDAWLATMLGWRMFAFSSALGHASERAAEAGRRGLAWIRNRCPLFARVA